MHPEQALVLLSAVIMSVWSQPLFQVHRPQISKLASLYPSTTRLSFSDDMANFLCIKISNPSMMTDWLRLANLSSVVGAFSKSVLSSRNVSGKLNRLTVLQNENQIRNLFLNLF
jgi:hypothetical protein